MIGLLFRSHLIAFALLPGLAIGQAPVASDPPAEQQGVTSDQITRASEEPGNWLTYSGQYNGQRYSQLREINSENVQDLKVKWVRQFSISEPFECSPLVIDEVMYVTLPENQLWALDAGTGLPYWKYQYKLPSKLAVCCGKINRGVAILGETLFMGTLDAKLVAIDARSGNEIWTSEVGIAEDGYSITGAPLVVKDMVITGIAGGEYGIRGYLDAYDAKTGDRRWRTYTIPGDGEPGNETWEGESWKIGGSPTWMTGSYDPDLNLLYWGVGNPGPDWNGEVRQGDNLYSDCVLAIDPDSGKIKWHFQFTPHDVHDWDACQIPVLVDTEYQGQTRKLMLFGNRNGFYYVLDRETGEFLNARSFAEQTWAIGIDKKGRPIRKPGMLPSDEGVLVYPDVSGAANWYSPSYSPKTGLFYLMAFDGGATYYITKEPEYVKGLPFMGGTATFNESQDFVNSEYVSAVRALDATSGEKKWEYVVQAKSTSGVLSTAGNVLFGGTKPGNFFALDATNGDELWHLDIGGWVHAAPITYEVNGKQYVSIAAGSSLFTFGL